MPKLSEEKIDSVRIRGCLYLLSVDVAAPDLTAEGIFVMDEETAVPHLRLAPGLQLHGLSARDEGIDSTSQQGDRFMVISCTSDAGASLVIESGQVIEDPADRFAAVPAGATTIGVDQRPIMVIFSAAQQRWIVPDWDFYDPVPAHWADPDPTSKTEAIDRLAAAVSMSGVTPIP